ncbi:uncharacterized protein [Amphiura filiformis]|uniref:uncharacterized protein n=1 Tax=Amphiura filiformis TaxID=82378 RepID=UPI003B217C20
MATSKLLFTLVLLFMFSITVKGEHAKVLILGAGTAGIQAAGTLSENGFTDFLVIEGADYVGGRVKNALFDGITVGVGAQWTPVTHPEFNEKLLNAWNISGSEIDFSLAYRNSSSGLEVPEDVAGPVWEKLTAALETTAKVAQDILDNEKPDVSQRTALIKGGWIAQTPLERVIEWLSFDYESAESISVTSLLSSAFRNYDGLNYIIDPRGYAAMFEFMAPYLYQNDTTFNRHVRLNQRVTTIDYSGDDVVTVTCEDGSVYTSDYVFVTFHIGVFHNNLVQFIPDLPAWKKDIIYQISSISYTAIYLSFPERFWENVETILNVDERYNYYPAFINFDYFRVFPEDTHILTTHIVGDEARRIEHQSDEETKQEIEELLQRMYGLDTPPRASEFLIHSWLRDPLHMGAYTNRPAEVQQDDLPKLQARVDRVFFGGEVTNGGRGGVGDAWESGIREATKILRCIDGEECPEYKEPTAKCECDATILTDKQRKNCKLATCYPYP